MTDGSDRLGDPSTTRPASPGFDSAVATGKGDTGTTGLLFGGERIRKDDLRTEAYGTIDEAVAALGVAHGDLSAYNLLAAGERLVLIDLPQAVDIVANPAGMDFLMRDCHNVATWFTGKGHAVDEHDLFAELLAVAL